ncbi:RING finger protein 220 [Camponotus floridanus]|uniref:RING finger protein 220 n=1 Tax=Camponotus floridanus TaxID=104421 RepID=E2A881_CAMFO|nr:RING finger protein 220 [Camponotus floridanus]
MLHAPSAADGTPQGRWETYKRIKANRQARIRVKNRKRKADEASCPVCNERLSGTPEELNQHVDRCLNKQNNGNPAGQNTNLDEEEVDVEGDAETFEEYEWAGQKRVRASSMLVGGFSAAGLATSSSNRSGVGGGGGSHEDEDVDLVVDGDDAAEFGPAQYSEADVVAPRIDGTPREQKERDALREAVISPNAPHPPQQLTPDAGLTAQGLVEVKPEPGTTTPVAQQNDPDEGASGVSPRRDGDTPVMEALRGRIRELEAEMRGQLFKCLICMEQYKKPVTSVCCWHVHCEECWLHTLAAEVEVAKTEVEEVAAGGESGGEGGARHCAPYGSAAVTGGEGKECSRGDAFGAQGDDDKSFDKMVARYASATPHRKKRVSMESSSLTSSRDRFALDK